MTPIPLTRLKTEGRIDFLSSEDSIIGGIRVMKKIGFIGLGVMGKPMAINLVRSGYEVTVYDRLEKRVRELVSVGAKAANGIEQVVKGKDVIMTMLPNSPHVREVLIAGDCAVIDYVRSGAIVVDMSSISPTVTKEIYRTFKQKKVSFIDAPVSGGRIGAETRSLSIMVGGDEAAFENVKEILQKLGNKITYMGKSGAGQTTKICNQTIVAGTVTTISEALAIAKREGLDLLKVREVLIAGGANCWHLEHKALGMIAEDFSTSFKAELMLKDIRLAVEKAQQEGLNLPVLSKIKEMYEELIEEYGGDIDYTAIYKKISEASAR